MRKKTLKRVVSSVLGISLLLTTMTGCGGKKPDATTSTAGSTGSDATTNESKYEDTLVIDVFDSQANYQGTQSGWFGDYIKKKFNIELNIIAPNVAGGGDTLFQTRSANGDLGDIIITNLDQSRLKDMVEAGLVLDMSDYIDDCPNLQRYMTAIEGASALAEKDGIWAIPSEVSTMSATEPCDATEPTVAPSLRWDIYGQIGYPEMKNTDDLLNVLKDMQDAAGTSDSGKQVYALSLFKDWDGDAMQNADGIKGLYGYQQVGFCMAKVDGTDIQSVLDEDGIYYKSLKFLFDANQLGILDPESTTQDFSTLQNKYKDGAVLYSLWPWLGASQYNTAEHTSEGKGFATAIIDDMQCLEYGCMPYGKLATGIMIGSKAEQPERVAEFIDWLYSPEGIEIALTIDANTCGPEGLTWEMKDGQPVLTDFGIDAFVNKNADLQVPDEWGGGSYSDGACKLNYKAVGLVDRTPDDSMCYNYLKWDDYQAKTATTLSNDWSEHNDGATNTIDLLKEKNKLLVLPGTNYATPEYSTDINTIKGQCKQIIVEYSWKMVFAENEDEFNALFQEMKETAEGLGFNDVLAVDKQNCEDQYKAFEDAKAVSK
ncbi:MAG: ABC transporter substrate-binding protein [Wujia sp.]